MASLLNLPTEILDAVLELLPRASLRSLCWTHRVLGPHAEPRLYAAVEWTWGDYQTPPITLLLRTFLQRPELTQHVRTLIISGACLAGSETPPPKMDIATLDMDKLVAYINSTSVPFANLWIQEASAGTIDALITTLISQLSNLKCLYLGPNITEESNLFGMMIRSAIFTPMRYKLPSFQKLSEVEYHRRVEDPFSRNIVDPADALSLFYLPTVRHILAFVRNPAVFAWPAETPDASNITSLDIKGLRESHLGNLLSVTKSLRKLCWQWHHEPSLRYKDQFDTPTINLDQIVDALLLVGETLTDLTLIASCNEEGPDYPTLCMTGSFRGAVGLSKLKSLQVPLVFLVGISQNEERRLETSIPRSVECLAITDNLYPNCVYEWEEENLFELFKLYMNGGKESTPCIRDVALHIGEMIEDWYVDGWYPEVFVKYTNYSAHSGVRVQVVA